MDYFFITHNNGDLYRIQYYSFKTQRDKEAMRFICTNMRTGECFPIMRYSAGTGGYYCSILFKAINSPLVHIKIRDIFPNWDLRHIRALTIKGCYV